MVNKISEFSTNFHSCFSNFIKISENVGALEESQKLLLRFSAKARENYAKIMKKIRYFCKRGVRVQNFLSVFSLDGYRIKCLL